MAKKKNDRKRSSKRRGPSAAKEFSSSSKYLKGADITEPFDATISGMEQVEFDDGKKKWVLHPEDNGKSIVLNQTNGFALAEDLGDDLDGWIGRRIRIFTERRKNPQTGLMGPAVAVCGASEDDPDDLPDDDEDDDLE